MLIKTLTCFTQHNWCINKYTMGDFTFWISLSLRPSLSPKYGLRPKISETAGIWLPRNWRHKHYTVCVSDEIEEVYPSGKSLKQLWKQNKTTTNCTISSTISAELNHSLHWDQTLSVTNVPTQLLFISHSQPIMYNFETVRVEAVPVKHLSRNGWGQVSLRQKSKTKVLAKTFV